MRLNYLFTSRIDPTLENKIILPDSLSSELYNSNLVCANLFYTEYLIILKIYEGLLSPPQQHDIEDHGIIHLSPPLSDMETEKQSRKQKERRRK